MAIYAGTIEDARAAAALATSLSQYLITAALAILAAETALINALMDKREKLLALKVVACLLLVSCAASIITGARGITMVFQAGFDGNWQKAVGAAPFDLQAKLLLVSVALFAVSLIAGVTAKRRRGM
jgi:hypothetical protein